MWSRVSGPTGAIIMCLRQLGWTWPHHTTLVTGSGHEVDVRETWQARVDSDLALWKEWADNDELKELLPRPLLEPMILANTRPRPERPLA